MLSFWVFLFVFLIGILLIANSNILRALQGTWNNMVEIKELDFVELLSRPARPLDTFVEDFKQHFNDLIIHSRRE